MTVVQNDPVRKEMLIGAYISTRVHDYVTLYSLAHGISKSRILQELLFDWVSRQKESDNETVLLRKCIARIQKIRNKPRNRNYGLGEFKNKAEADLLTKGISEKYIALILSEIV